MFVYLVTCLSMVKLSQSKILIHTGMCKMLTHRYFLRMKEIDCQMIDHLPRTFSTSLFLGTVAKFMDRKKDTDSGGSRRKRNSNPYSRYTVGVIPKPTKTPEVELDDYMGYAVTSGNYSNSHKLLYAAGAPKGRVSYGKVMLVSCSTIDYFTD